MWTGTRRMVRMTTVMIVRADVKMKLGATPTVDVPTGVKQETTITATTTTAATMAAKTTRTEMADGTDGEWSDATRRGATSTSPTPPRAMSATDRHVAGSPTPQ